MLVILLIALLTANRKKESEHISVSVEGLGVEGMGGRSTVRGGEEMSGERFCMLSEIDRNREKYGAKRYEQGISLEYFCESFRNYAANKLKLYYEIEDIRRFIASLTVSHIIIMQGMSGTGKTSLPKIVAEALNSNCDIVEVESSWRDKNELLGYYNEFSKIEETIDNAVRNRAYSEINLYYNQCINEDFI